MAWIESHTVLLRHRKLIMLSKDLRLKPVYTLGHLHSLWHAALEQADNGDLSSWSDEFIAESACYEGSAPQFVSLLQKHRWLDGKVLHDWLDYAGKYLKECKYRRHQEKWLEIENLHKSLKTTYMTESVQVIATLPNPTDLTDLKRQPSAASYSQEFIDKSKVALSFGFNVYQQVGKYRKGKLINPPEQLLSEIVDEFLKNREQIKDIFPYMATVIREKCRRYSADKNEQEGNAFKKDAVSIGDILKPSLQTV